MGDGASWQTTAEDWLDGFRTSMPLLEGLLFGSLVIDARTGAVVASNPRARELLGGEVPGHVQDLVETGVLSRPDLDALAAEAVGPHPSSWRRDLAAHLPSGRRELTLLGGSVEHPGIDGRAVVALVCERGRERIYVDDPRPGEPPRTLHFAWDGLLRVRSVDPRLADLWEDITLGIGAYHWMHIHPADLHLAARPLARLLAEGADWVEYTVRVVTHLGNWVPARVEVRRLVGTPETPFQVTYALVSEFKETLVDGQLTARERIVVAALFDGHRVQQIADRDGVSTKTLRNQLSAVYRKLSVNDQGELLERYHRPVDVPTTAPDLSGWTWPEPRTPGRRGTTRWRPTP